jgi:hypothetical protein
VARTLEREWNDALSDLEHLDRDYHDMRRRERIELAADDRARIAALATDLPAVWHATTTTHAERKNLLRMVVREVTVSPIEVPARSGPSPDPPRPVSDRLCEGAMAAVVPALRGVVPADPGGSFAA